MDVQILEIIAGLAFLIALIFSIKLYLETDRKWYWLSFCVSAFVFMVTHFVRLIWPLSIVDLGFLALIQESGEILGGLFFAAACYGIYTGMKEIRKKSGMIFENPPRDIYVNLVFT